MTSRDFFKGKRIALVGLGPDGEMVEDARFMIKAGALLSVYDLRSESRLKGNLVLLRSVGLANYVCGSIPADDLVDMDLIILSHEYPRESSFLKAAKEKNIRIEYPETLFFKLAPPLSVVGVMGLSGKSTVISMLSPMLEEVCRDVSARTGELPDHNTDNGDDNDRRRANGPAQNLFVADPESGDGIINFLRKAKNGDILLMRITDEIQNELRDICISPQVAVFTTVPGRGAYSDSPFEVLNRQTYNNFIIANDEIIDATRLYRFQPKAKMLRTKPALIPEAWEFKGRKHDREDAALALQAARLFKVSDETAEKILGKWKPLRGRMEPVKKVRNVEYYNDTASTSPHSTIASIIALAENRNIVLILGGAESGHDYRELNSVLPQYAHTVILLPGSGTMKERRILGQTDRIDIFSAPSVEEAVRLASDKARTGDKVLFSPGFRAAGLDPSRKERGERFVRAVRGL